MTKLSTCFTASVLFATNVAIHAAVKVHPHNKKFVVATAKIAGDMIVVSSAEVSKPVAVRYGWDNVPDVNLFNKEGLPASPFRTE